MPLISHAVESKDSTHNVERICTSQGVKFISTENHSSDKNHTNINMMHCAYCSITSDKNYLPESKVQLGLTLIPNAAKFFLEYESPILVAYFRTSFSAQAPPLF
jgi:trehalose/maltose hydrolase-like predicted phosphorylase